jgi:hypothetical protein
MTVLLPWGFTRLSAVDEEMSQLSPLFLGLAKKLQRQNQ